MTRLSRFLPRYTLRTLAIALLAVPAAVGFCIRWAPWRCVLSIDGHSSRLVAAEFFPDGNRIMTASADGVISIFSASGTRVRSLPCRYDIAFTCLSPDGTKIAYTHRLGIVIIWDINSKDLRTSAWGVEGSALRLLTDRIGGIGHRGPVHHVEFSPNGERILTAGCDGTVKIWDARTFERLLTLEGATQIQHDTPASFSPDGKQVLAVGPNDTIEVWDTEVGSRKRSITGRAGKRVCSAAFSPDGSQIAIVTGAVEIRDLQTDETRCIFVPADVSYPVTIDRPRASYSPCGRYIVTSGFGSIVEIWATEDGQKLATLDHPKGVKSARFAADGERIITACDDGVVRVWQRQRPEQWWGVFCMLEFWAAALLCPFLAWSLWRDRRYFKTLDERLAASLAAKAAAKAQGGSGASAPRR